MGPRSGSKDHEAAPQRHSFKHAGSSPGVPLLGDGAWLHERGALRPDFSLANEGVESVLDFACLAVQVKDARSGAEPPWRSEMRVL